MRFRCLLSPTSASTKISVAGVCSALLTLAITWPSPHDHRLEEFEVRQINKVSHRPIDLPFDCSTIDEMQVVRVLGHGWAKSVYLGTYRGQQVALKIARSNSTLAYKCSRMGTPPINETYCSGLVSMRLMKEILFLQKLKHPNIIKLLGFCVRGSNVNSNPALSRHDVAIFEYGRRFRFNNLLESWESRIACASQLADLLVYLEHSPLGSVLDKDLKLEQFLIINSSVKLADFDSVAALEPMCRKPNATTARGKSLAECDLNVVCSDGLCKGYNAKYNLNKFHRLLFSVILQPSEFPSLLRTKLRSIYLSLDEMTIDASELLKRLNSLLGDRAAVCVIS